jgi:hypothetical protein
MRTYASAFPYIFHHIRIPWQPGIMMYARDLWPLGDGGSTIMPSDDHFVMVDLSNGAKVAWPFADDTMVGSIV